MNGITWWNNFYLLQLFLRTLLLGKINFVSGKFWTDQIILPLLELKA